LHDAYLVFCDKYTLPPEKYDHFCKILKNQFDIREIRVEVEDGKREMWWKGLTLTTEYAPELARLPWLP
jgi:hypothetical protein